MGALAHIKAYLKAHFANHDIETLMTHFETAIEAKVEEALADLKQEIVELRNDLTGGRAPEPPPPVILPATSANLDPGGVTFLENHETTTESEQ